MVLKTRKALIEEITMLSKAIIEQNETIGMKNEVIATQREIINELKRCVNTLKDEEVFEGVGFLG